VAYTTPYFPHKLQCGFRKEHGATVATYVMKEIVSHYIDRGSNVFAAFLDNAKAFDRIWHDGLLLKVFNLGIHGRAWHIIKQSYHESSACVHHNGCKSRVFPVKQGVGQGRVLSAWMFLVYINDVIYKLDELATGLIIGNEHIPVSLLADDTTLLSSSRRDLQLSLDTLHKYACQWRLTYNADKSSVLIFRGGHKVDSCTEYSLGGTLLEVKETTVYAGSLICTKHSSERTTRACLKARKTIMSLKSIGLRAGGLHPIACVNIWRRIIVPCAFYACELWTNITKSEIEQMEKVQRLFARIVQNFHVRSSTLATIQTLGLWTMSGTIDKLKLCLLGRMCRTSPLCIVKCLMYFKSGQYSTGNISKTSITHDLLKTAEKYGLWTFMDEFYSSGQFTPKTIWNNIVSSKIEEYEVSQWKENLSKNSALTRYYSIHSSLRPHRLWGMCMMYAMYSKSLFSIVKLSILPVTAGLCLICECESEDIVKHQLLFCTKLYTRRNKLYELLFDRLSLQAYMRFEDCQSDEILIRTLLGGITTVTETMTLDEWFIFTSIVACEIDSWELKSLLYL